MRGPIRGLLICYVGVYNGAVCFVSVFVSVVFCNSEVSEHPDMLFTCFYDNRTNQQFPRSRKALSVINSVITVYHKSDYYFYDLIEHHRDFTLRM